jgi:hypothetical protein
MVAVRDSNSSSSEDRFTDTGVLPREDGNLMSGTMRMRNGIGGSGSDLLASWMTVGASTRSV